MADHSHIVTDDHRTLDGSSNGGTPYDCLHLDIDEDGTVSLFSLSYHGGDGTPMNVWNGRTRRYTLAPPRRGVV